MLIQLYDTKGVPGQVHNHRFLAGEAAEVVATLPACCRHFEFFKINLAGPTFLGGTGCGRNSFLYRGSLPYPNFISANFITAIL